MPADKTDTTTCTTPPKGSLAKLPVVLVHGIWNRAEIFTALKTYLEANGHTVHALSMTPNNGDAPLETLADQVMAFVDSVLIPQELKIS